MKSKRAVFTAIAVILAILALSLVLAACPGPDPTPTPDPGTGAGGTGGTGDTGGPGGGGVVVPPEDKPAKDRWGKYVASDSKATLVYSVADDDVCTITVGGTAESNNETNGWNRYKATAQYSYTSKANTKYTYVFEAWTESGNRVLNFQYYGDNDTSTYLTTLITITGTRTTFKIDGDTIPKGGVRSMDFQCADQLGTFYVKIISITDTAYNYTITGSGAAFTATSGGETVGTANKPIQDVIDAIRTHAEGVNCAIQLGNGTAVLNIGTAYVTLENTASEKWGAITLTGKLTSSNDSNNGTISISSPVSVTSSADIANTASGNGRAIYNDSTGTVTITGGTVSAISNFAVFNNSTGTVTISGGTVSVTTGSAVLNVSTGTVNISGGTVSVATGKAVWNDGTGAVNITGGTVSTTEVYGDAVFNNSTGAVNISGGTVSAIAGYAVYMGNANAMLTLSGSPTITGRIRPSAAGKLRAASGFSPGTKKYMLEYATYTRASIVVTGGARCLSSFTLYDPTRWTLAAKGDDIVLEINLSFPYIITSNGTSFTATQNNYSVGTANQPIQTLIDGIRTEVNGDACTIQFGNGTAELNVGTAYVTFSNSGSSTWGAITLTGKITSSNNNSSNGTISISSPVSVTSSADIANTASGNNGRAIYNGSTGTLTITGGTVSGGTGNAIHNGSTGTLTITGGTVSVTSNIAVYNYSSGAVNISGGMVSGGTGAAVYNSSTGTVSISDGTVSATGSNGIAVYNNSTGAVNISGGTVSATGSYGNAVRNNSTGKITVSGTAIIYSPSTSTIYLAEPATDSTSLRLEMTGGRVTNTTTGGNAIRNFSTGAVSISGGTVSTTEINGYAISNDSTGAVTISDGTVSATGSNGRAVYNGSRGAVTISGGAVSATSGYAVDNRSTGKITVSGTANITSANSDSSYGGTIYLAAPETDSTSLRLEITGGTVANTSTTTGNAIRNNSTGAVSISGGTVSKAGTGANANYAIYNNSTGVVTISSPPAVISGGKYGCP